MNSLLRKIVNGGYARNSVPNREWQKEKKKIYQDKIEVELDWSYKIKIRNCIKSPGAGQYHFVRFAASSK